MRCLGHPLRRGFRNRLSDADSGQVSARLGPPGALGGLPSRVAEMEVTQRSTRRYDYGAAGPALAPSVTKRRVFRADRPCVGALSLLQNTVILSGRMAATTGLTLLVLLLYCGQGADLPPIDVTSDASIHESDQLSVPEGFHKLADLSPISLETEDKILNGKKHPKTDQQLKQSVLDMILQNIGKSSGKVNNGVVTRGVVPLVRREALSPLRGPSGAVSSSGEEPPS
ncbi:hypothetical protein MG293_011284 [Ovis ammon polii]|uniref:Uncharacterized protein n=1 Tax=Ovis ammon polii TaxID=230172 RepID=A0AAD4U667_OVIAM|nr:hypothetical protein MG293_011284 [Ovis ammon polii]